MAIMSPLKDTSEKAGTWIVKDVPREVMYRMKVAAAMQRKTIKQLLFDLSAAHLQALERKGILPRRK